MKLILIIILNLLLFNCCSSANGQNKTSLLTLNGDVLFLIFAEMDIVEWVNLAEIHSGFVVPANDAFHHKYREYQVRFDDNIYRKEKYQAKKPAFENQPNGDPIYSKPKELKRLMINDHQLALKVLRYFSSNFQTLVLNNRYSSGAANEILWKTVNQFVNRYTSDYLTHLKILIIDNTLEQYALSFKNVEIFEGGINVNRITGNVLPFNQMFPKLRKIELILSKAASFKIIDCEFAHLENVALSLSANAQEKENQNHIHGFVDKNSQIKILEILDFSWKSVEYFSQNLPNLVNLRLNLKDIKSDKIEFKSVTIVDICEDNGNYATTLSFPQLESIKFRYSYRQRFEWTRFFNKHKTLKKLALDEITYEHHGYNRGRDDLVFLTENLTDLVEVKLSCDHLMTVQKFTQLIESHSNLMKFTYKLRGLYRVRNSEIRNLREQFGNQWNITQIGNDNKEFIDIILEKKN